MIYFKLDIPRINKNLDDYVNNKKEFMDSMNLIYGMLYNVDGVWNDNNTENFLQKIKEDKNKIDDYFYNLDKIYKEIGIFKNNIDTICRNSNYKKGSFVLSFNDINLNSCYNFLHNAINYVDSAIYEINGITFPEDFESLWLVSSVVYELYSIQSLINQLIQYINNFARSINREVTDSKIRLKKIENFDLNIEKIKYDFSVVDFVTNYDGKNPLTEQQNNLSTNSGIKISEVQKVEGITDGVVETAGKEKNIELNEIKKVEGITNGVVETTGKEKNIESNEIKKIEGLTNGVAETSINRTNLNMNKINDASGLDNLIKNVNYFNTDGPSIKLDSVANENVNLDVNSIDTTTNNNQSTFDSIVNTNLNLDVNSIDTTTNNNQSTFDSVVNPNLNLDVNPINELDGVINDINLK